MSDNDEHSVAKITNLQTRRYGLIGILAAVGIILSYASFKVTRNWEEDRSLHHFRELTENHGVAIEKELLTHLDFLHSITAFYATSPFVSREDFRTFTKSLLIRAPGVQALEWIPRISAGERERYERIARSDGFPDFRIKEKNAKGKMVSAGTRAEYFPVYYVEPLKGNERALGFDLGSNATRHDALAKARDTGKVIVSGRIKLIQETGDQFAFLAFQPIFKKKYPLNSAELRRKFLLGFALGVFRIGDVVENALAKQAGPGGFDIYVFDNSSPAGNRFLYFHPSRVRQTKVAPESEETIFGGPHLTFGFPVGDREWTLVFKPVTGYFVENSTWVPWSTLFVGLVFTSILTAYLVSAVGRERRITNLVRERTGALKDSETRIRAVVDNVVDGIITIRETGEIETFNPAAEQIFGYMASQMIGQNVKILMPESYSSEHDGYLRAYRETGEAKIIGIGREVVGMRKDGSTFPLDLAVSEMQIGGNQIFTGVVRDITERKKIERMKSEFMSTVSHELRTPLTSIRGSLGMVESGALKDPEKVTRMIRLAANNTERLINLVNDLLDMEKLQSGQMEFYMKKASLTKIVNDSIEVNKPFADKHKVKFKLTETVPDAFVKGDSDRLAQVLANLLSNAAKFSPEEETVEVSLIHREGSFRIIVSDRGPGIPDEFRDRLFDRFTQADATDTRQKGGTGLGLNISQVIVEKHGGVIGFESEPGNGATFYIDLPEYGKDLWASPAPGAPDESAAKPKFIEGHRILVIEDDSDVAELITIMLEQYGAVCDTAYGVTDAREKLADSTYQAITLDILLPDGSGVNLLKDLRNNDATKDIPVVVVSAVAHDSREQVLTSVIGVMDWLDKPIDEKRLIRAIRRGTDLSTNGHSKILIVEDDIDLTEVLKNLIGDLADVTVVATLKQARHELQLIQWSLVVLDIGLPDGSGLDLIPLLKNEGKLPTPVIIFSAEEVGNDIASKVEYALVKSQTSNEDLLAMIKAMVSKFEGIGA